MSAIHIVLHGLIALVPATDASGMANHMTALLVDARAEPATKLECFAPHLPILMVKTTTSAECVAAGCSVSGSDDCTCELIHKEVSLGGDIHSDQKQKLNKQPETGLPFEQRDAGDFSYVANLSRAPLNQELDKRFLDPVPPTALIARMSFPFSSVSACSLGTRRDEGSNNVHPMGFRLLHATEKAGEASQALAQQVMATLETDQNPVTLILSDFGGANPKILTLKPINGEYMIQLMNMRNPKSGPNDLRPDDPCDDGVGRDFSFFYELVKNPPSWDQRPIPHIKYTRWKSSKDLEVDECVSHPTAAPDSHPICAMVTFNP